MLVSLLLYFFLVLLSSSAGISKCCFGEGFKLWTGFKFYVSLKKSNELFLLLFKTIGIVRASAFHRASRFSHASGNCGFGHIC